MRIVHLMSQMGLTGAEVYAVSLAEGMIDRGHEVTIISDTLQVPTRAKVISRRIHRAKHFWQRWREILFLRRYFVENQIDVVHTHSRAAVRLAWWATRWTTTAQVSTIHGRQHFSVGKRIFDTYGQRVLTVCGALKEQLVRELRMRATRVEVLGNPLHPLCDKNYGEAPPERWLFVSRWSGPKGQRGAEFLAHVLPTFMERYPNLTLDMAGAFSSSNEEARLAVEALQQRFPGRVRTLGSVVPVEIIVPNYGLVIGGGRVAMSALAMGRACMAFGEALTHGLIDEANLKSAVHSNFGDTHPELKDTRLNVSLVSADLGRWMTGGGPDKAERERLRQYMLAHFGFARILDEMLDIYRSARLIKAHAWPIPALMYHQIVDEEIETPHRIFVTVSRFRKHLRTLKFLGFQTVTFADLLEFREGRRPLSEFPRRPILLTFDDGYENNLTNAAPLLKEFGMKGVLFLLADPKLQHNAWDEGQAPRAALLDPEKRKAIAATQVFEIGSHGFNHRKLIDMKSDEALRELKESKLALERELNQTVHAFAFPYGDSNSECSELAALAGYSYAVNTDRGGFHIEETPRGIFRVNIFPEDGSLQVAKKASTWYRWRYYMTRGR